MTEDTALLEWLAANGAVILEPTNSYEVARYKAGGGTHVIYRNAKGKHSYSNQEAAAAHTAYLNGGKWCADKKTKRVKRAPQVDALLKRDGNLCFFCGATMTDADMTIEHLIARSKGGNNHLVNLVLAHAHCNEQAADKSIYDKIKLREQLICKK